MEYLLGSLVTILALVVLRKNIVKDTENKSQIDVKYRQSHIFEMVKPFISFDNFKPRRRTQSTVFDDKRNVKVVILDQKAYWILDNVFFVADQIDGLIDKDTTRPVDTINMDKTQLAKMMVIVETLTEGDSDEDWYTRN